MGIETFQRHFHGGDSNGGKSNGTKSSSSATKTNDDNNLPSSQNQESLNQSNTLVIAFLKCDKIPEQARSKHGTYEQVLHNLLAPMLPKRKCKHKPSQRELNEENLKQDDEGVYLNDNEDENNQIENQQQQELQQEQDKETIKERDLPKKQDEQSREVVDFEIKDDTGHEELELELETRTYDVVHKREYPTESELEEIDAIIISGSFEDDSSSDTRWILRLAGFLIGVHDRLPRIRIVGICFGLQILARAFGPQPIIKNPKGWEIGSTKVYLSKLGKSLIYGDESDSPDYVMMQQIHADCAEKVPEDFELLGWSDKTPVQGICHLYDKDDVPEFRHSDACCASSDPWRRVHMIAFQGHPEWNSDIIVPFIDEYEQSGTITKEFAQESRQKAKEHHDGKILGRAILKVLGVA
ncbi:hypothetical protein OIO90_003309 [Microbotryomycetes sp. JL221]|nr:hypothetical protein OIO90_003309 [Microbotryomycetes sp. JL221]